MLRPAFVITLGISTAVAAPLTTTVLLAPPPAMKPVTVTGAVAPRRTKAPLWSIGQPTDAEQYNLELLNRARANPAAEGARLAAITDADVVTAYNYWKVDLAMMQAELNAVTAGPPLAMNEKLLEAARGHSLDMFTSGIQGHDGSDGSTIGTRIAAAGYAASYYAENVFIQSKSADYGHAAFEVDWGTGTGGMQSPRGHRDIQHAGFREVGIGIYEGSRGTGENEVGPEVLTQDFTVMAGTVTPFVTGVAYYDFNGNQFYDPGEGIGGVRVIVEGGSHEAVTADSGGYAVPVPLGPAVRPVTFTLGALAGTGTAYMTQSNNKKVDYKPLPAPAVSGPGPVLTGVASRFSLTPLPEATGYSWRVMRRVAAPDDNANDLTRVNTSTSGGYAVINTSVKQEGTGSFHLAQPSSPPRNETVTFKAVFHGGAAPVMEYQSRLRSAGVMQKAYVQVSVDGGVTWNVVDAQSGSGGTGDAAFTRRTVALTGLADRDFMLRFNFTVTGSGYVTGTGNSSGWFIDAVRFTDTLDTSGATITNLAGASEFTFTPAAAGEYLLSGRSSFAAATPGFGPVTAVTATAPVTYAAWAATEESAAGLPAGTLAGAPAGDTNTDGVVNLMAFALGLSPVTPSAAALPVPVRSGEELRLDYTRRLDRAGITLTPQLSTDLKTWFSPGAAGAPAGFTDSAVSTAGYSENRRAAVPGSGAPAYYLRLKVTMP